jgi:hypothetical protein
VLDPVLQPDKLVLEAEKLSKIDAPVELFAVRVLDEVGEEMFETAFVHLHFKLFVEAVCDLLLDAVESIGVGLEIHGSWHLLRGKGPTLRGLDDRNMTKART